MHKLNKKFNKILVAIDFSSTSEFVIARAIELAKSNNAEVTLLCVIEKTNMDEFLDQHLGKILPGSLWLTTEEYYQNLLHEKIASLSNLQIDIKQMIIPKGKPPIKILSYAKKNKFDLLIIGAHGKYSIRDAFVGTTAEYIVAKSNCPVLIIKNKSDKPYKNILVPVDFSNASKNALHLAIKLFPSSTINLLHVGDYDYENLIVKENIAQSKLTKIKKAVSFYLEDKMKKFNKSIRKKQNKLLYSIAMGHPAEIILNKYEKKNTDLIVMGTQGHSKKHYIFMGRISHAVFKETNKDILLVPPGK